MNQQFKFSIIMSVYKVEEYLEEAIESVVNQDIGFKDNIQLILVNDGSPDNSEEICLKYKEMYPDNIAYIKQENGGVSSARNAGLVLAEGQYVNFLDSDDLLTPNTMSAVWKFFEQHENETDVVSIPLCFFDGQTGQHLLNYKFKNGTRVIDLTKEYDAIQLSMSSAFVKRECLEGLSFDLRLAYCEDAQIMQKILIKKQTMGVISEAKYMYRRRTSGERSAVQQGGESFEWYMSVIRYFQLHIIDYCKKELGYIPKFIQYILTYDIQWRFKQREVPAVTMTEEEKDEYFQYVHEFLQNVDDEIIMNQKQLFREHKFFMLKIKYQREPEIRCEESDIKFGFSEDGSFMFSDTSIGCDFLDITKDYVRIEGMVAFFTGLFDKVSLYAQLGDYKYPLELTERHSYSKSLGREVQRAYGFVIRIPVSEIGKENKLRIMFKFKDTDIEAKNIFSRVFYALDVKFANSYFYKNKIIVKSTKNGVIVKKCSFFGHLFAEAAFLRSLLFSKKRGYAKAVGFRIAHHIAKIFKRKPIWIMCDRANKAGDNAEALFRYVVDKHPEIDSYFMINGDSPDYERMSKIGKVLKKDSYKHKFKMLLCDVLASSHAEKDNYNPFGGRYLAYRDILARNKFVFLQHGVTKDDVSVWLNKYNQNIAGFVTAAVPEHASIVEGKNYHYSKEQIWLTGFPRFDRLENRDEKIITIIPTWRKYLMGKIDHLTGNWSLRAGFEESEFFEYYSKLLNDEKLNEAAKKYGYKIALLPHPNLQGYTDSLVKRDDVLCFGKDTEYVDVYAKSSLIVTDYSSAVFDFAYIYKPIVYFQFDVDTFFSGDHTYSKGYFDYEKNGFGEVEYTVEKTVERVIEYMENDCRLKPEYRERVDEFFAFNDKDNCRRVCEKILNL